jgi:hypothetical protein
MNTPFHLVYIPAESLLRIKERIISLIQTDAVEDVLLQTQLAPGSIALQLESTTEDELRSELRDLGFTR